MMKNKANLNPVPQQHHVQQPPNPNPRRKSQPFKKNERLSVMNYSSTLKINKKSSLSPWIARLTFL